MPPSASRASRTIRADLLGVADVGAEGGRPARPRPRARRRRRRPARPRGRRRRRRRPPRPGSATPPARCRARRRRRARPCRPGVRVRSLTLTTGTLCPREAVCKSGAHDRTSPPRSPRSRSSTPTRLRAAVVATWTASMDSSPYASLADVPQSPLPLMTARPLLQHVNEVNDLALHFLDLAVARFELPVDRDAALATAILHDVDKPMIYRRGDGPELDYAPGTQLSDHGAIGADLAASHGVPTAIVEMIRVHSPFASDRATRHTRGHDRPLRRLRRQRPGLPPVRRRPHPRQLRPHAKAGRRPLTPAVLGTLCSTIASGTCQEQRGRSALPGPAVVVVGPVDDAGRLEVVHLGAR